MFFSSINEQFSAKQQGYKLSMDHMKFNKDVSLQITKEGHAACQVKAHLTPDYPANHYLENDEPDP